MDFAYSNGSDALALTDHGNMNGLSYQVLHAKKMRAEGRNFKPIYGIEAYFVKSLSEWKKVYNNLQESKKKGRGTQSAATVEDKRGSIIFSSWCPDPTRLKTFIDTPGLILKCCGSTPRG
jgi:hypothetical protein